MPARFDLDGFIHAPQPAADAHHALAVRYHGERAALFCRKGFEKARARVGAADVPHTGVIAAELLPPE